MFTQTTSPRSNSDTHFCYGMEVHRRLVDYALLPLGITQVFLKSPCPLVVADISGMLKSGRDGFTDYAYLVMFSIPLTDNHDELVARWAAQYDLSAAEINRLVSAALGVARQCTCPFCHAAFVME